MLQNHFASCARSVAPPPTPWHATAHRTALLRHALRQAAVAPYLTATQRQQLKALLRSLPTSFLRLVVAEGLV